MMKPNIKLFKKVLAHLEEDPQRFSYMQGVVDKDNMQVGCFYAWGGYFAKEVPDNAVFFEDAVNNAMGMVYGNFLNELYKIDPSWSYDTTAVERQIATFRKFVEGLEQG